jgi:hypothetical protein
MDGEPIQIAGPHLIVQREPLAAATAILPFLERIADSHSRIEAR